MKIAYLLASSMISGGGKVIFQQADELARRGHRVTVVCPEGAPDWYSLRRASYERSDLARSAAVLTADVVVATFWTTIGPALDRASGRVFHLCQGRESESEFYAGQREAIEAAYRRIPGKIVVSPHLREALEKAGYSDVSDVGETFDAEEFRVEGRDFERRPLRILLVGIFELDIKGVSEALRALDALRGSGERFGVLRASPEPISPEERGMNLVDEYHCALSPRRMPALLARADVFVGPNHETEGFGLPSLEALAAGLPAALSDTPSHREIAGESAIFFPPGEPAGIARAVGRLLSEPETRRWLSAQGPRRAARFRTFDVGDRLERVFSGAAGAEP